MTAQRALAPAFAVINDEITPEKISRDIGLPESLVREWITHAQAYADGSGYRLFFKPDTPDAVRSFYPRMTAGGMLIVLAT